MFANMFANAPLLASSRPSFLPIIILLLVIIMISSRRRRR